MKQDPKYDAIEAIRIADDGYNNNSQFSCYSPIYIFTTENLKGLFKNFLFENKNVLTVCSSGDHFLNSKLLGAKQIDSFDINILTKYFTELKIAAILEMDFKAFYDAFYYINTNLESVYYKLQDYLSDDAKVFWNKVFSVFNGHKNILQTSFVRPTFDFMICVEDNNLYLDEKNYQKLKQILNIKDFNFIHSPLQKLDENLKDFYDIMFLSNINDYLDEIYSPSLKSRERKYKDYIKNELFCNLNEGGEIVSSYLYNSFCYSKPQKEIIKTFSKDARKVDFASACDSFLIDSALILKK